MKVSRKKFYIRLTASGRPILGSVVERYHMPKLGRWADITPSLELCCQITTTTTTTTTTSTSSTTTSTTTA